MEMKVDVSISLENKKVTGTVDVTEDDWNTDAFAAVLDALNSQHHLELSKFYDDKNIVVDWGDIVGRLNMADQTSMLTEERLKQASAWFTIDISESGEIAVENDDYTKQMLDRLQELFPALGTAYTTCPVCMMPEVLYSLIIHLNDLHDYTRHDIADFLEALDVSLEIQR